MVTFVLWFRPRMHRTAWTNMLSRCAIQWPFWHIFVLQTSCKPESRCQKGIDKGKTLGLPADCGENAEFTGSPSCFPRLFRHIPHFSHLNAGQCETARNLIEQTNPLSSHHGYCLCCLPCVCSRCDRWVSLPSESGPSVIVVLNTISVKCTICGLFHLHILDRFAWSSAWNMFTSL